MSTEKSTVALYPLISAAINADAEKSKVDYTCYILNGYMPSWNEHERKNPDAGIERCSTARRLEQYKAGEITREKAVQLATARKLKAIDKDTAEKLQRLQDIATAPDITSICVSVVWHRNYTWGYNPHAECWTDRNADGTTGTASGCGYDKQSAAIADALNKDPAILKVLCTIKEKALQDGKSDACKTASTGRNNSECCGYGAGYTAIPYFEGGVGTSCFWGILEKAGFSVSGRHSDKSDFYTLEKTI